MIEIDVLSDDVLTLCQAVTSKAAIRDFCERLTCRIEDMPAVMTPTAKRRQDESDILESQVNGLKKQIDELTTEKIILSGKVESLENSLAKQASEWKRQLEDKKKLRS